MRQRFRLKQDGIPVAWAEGPQALGEICHYAMVYAQDGPVMIEHHTNGKWRKFHAIGNATAALPTPIEAIGIGE